QYRRAYAFRAAKGCGAGLAQISPSPRKTPSTSAWLEPATEGSRSSSTCSRSQYGARARSAVEVSALHYDATVQHHGVDAGGRAVRSTRLPVVVDRVGVEHHQIGGQAAFDSTPIGPAHALGVGAGHASHALGEPQQLQPAHTAP